MSQAAYKIPEDRSKKIELIELLEERLRRQRANLAKSRYESFYPWQLQFCKNTEEYYECCLSAANQIGKCVSYDTKIETECGPKKIGHVFGQGIKVKTHPTGEFKNVLAWVIKPPEECYRITMSDGSWVEVPMGHRILVGSDFLRCDELFQVLPVSVFSPRLSISVFSLLIRASGAGRLMQKCVDLIHHCLVYSRLNDAQLLSDQDNVQVFAPSQADVQPHIGHLLRLGDWAKKYIYSLFCRLYRPSNLYVVRRFLARFFLRSIPSCAYAGQSSIGHSQEFLQFSTEERLVQQDNGLFRLKLFSSGNASYQAPCNKLKPSYATNNIVSVYSVGVKCLYDMEVDGSNYIAAGMVHHNTRVGTTIDALHLLGDYPDDYPGHRFDFPPMIWCLGYSMEKTRDLLQTALFGAYSPATGFAGGLIPADRIHGHEASGGTVNAMRTIKVKHRLGVSVVQFWSYTQGQHAIMGDVVDWVHVDEEPRDQTIRPQLLTRTINGDRGKGGRIIYTFTPENGRTDLVIQFMDSPSPTQSYMQIGWNQAPHMTTEKKERLLAQYPEYQRKMRSEGEPMLGHGRIYDIADEFITCDPFPIPDFWRVICGIDFGWDHPQAVAKLAIDPDNDIVYLINSWKASKTSASEAFFATQSWSRGVPVAWPSDGLQHEKGRDVNLQQKDHYIKAGFNLLPDHATWDTGGVSLESGLYQILDRQRKGQFKIFAGQPEYMAEHRQYRRDDKGKVVDVSDDLLAAARYAYMMRRYAKRVGEIGQKPKVIMPRPLKTMGR